LFFIAVIQLRGCAVAIADPHLGGKEKHSTALANSRTSHPEKRRWILLLASGDD
jgi:hypothetical protein